MTIYISHLNLLRLGLRCFPRLLKWLNINFNTVEIRTWRKKIKKSEKAIESSDWTSKAAYTHELINYSNLWMELPWRERGKSFLFVFSFMFCLISFFNLLILHYSKWLRSTKERSSSCFIDEFVSYNQIEQLELQIKRLLGKSWRNFFNLNTNKTRIALKLTFD